MKNLLQLFTFGLLILIVFTIASCQTDDDDMTDPGNEQEVITTVQITFTTNTGAAPVTFVFSDEDGPGGQAPLVDQIALEPNTSYEVSVEFLDRSNASNPVFITDEVRDEAEEHLVCYAVSGAMPALTIKDQDANGNPLGLIADLQTGAAGNGILTVSLKHEPVKTAATPCNTGETDVEALFLVLVN